MKIFGIIGDELVVVELINGDERACMVFRMGFSARRTNERSGTVILKTKVSYVKFRMVRALDLVSKIRFSR
jgi:hypothetical protein